MLKFNNRLAKAGLAGVLAALMLFAPLSTAFAADPPGTGQPGVECEDVRPGNSASGPGSAFSPGNSTAAPGSAFNEDGMAGTVYAGEQPQNSNNPHSVSQYDVACFQMEQP
jgi:hypothetical protein